MHRLQLLMTLVLLSATLSEASIVPGSDEYPIRGAVQDSTRTFGATINKQDFHFDPVAVSPHGGVLGEAHRFTLTEQSIPNGTTQPAIGREAALALVSDIVPVPGTR